MQLTNECSFIFSHSFHVFHPISPLMFHHSFLVFSPSFDLNQPNTIYSTQYGWLIYFSDSISLVLTNLYYLLPQLYHPLHIHRSLLPLIQIYNLLIHSNKCHSSVLPNQLGYNIILLLNTYWRLLLITKLHSQTNKSS